jgi:hypothetical protein
MHLRSVNAASFFVFDNRLPEHNAGLDYAGVTSDIGVITPASAVATRGGSVTAGSAYVPMGSKGRFPNGTWAAATA